MEEREIIWVGSSLDDVKAFPPVARRETGHQLGRVQHGLMPGDFKYMRSVGTGVYEIRIKDDGDQYRVFYVAKFEEGIYVLHAFEKKTRKTSQKDIEIAKKRYSEVLHLRGAT